jgi:hypothetical protein
MMKTIQCFTFILLVAAVLGGCRGGSSEKVTVTLNVSFIDEDGGVRNKLDVSDNSGLKTVRSGSVEPAMYGVMLVGEGKQRDRRINLLIDYQERSVVAFVSFSSPLTISVTFPMTESGDNKGIVIIHDGLAHRENMVYAQTAE